MKFTNKTLALIIFIITSMVVLLLLILSTGVNGETDSITHYQIARYAFKYPANFLNHWGKPLFTILASPMAQFGYTGAMIFNLICGLLSSWFAYLIARRMEYRHAWAAIIFTIFTPLYLFIMYTSLTEILFSMVLIASIYLFISKRFIWSAVVISLIPFARTEGVMFLILFVPAFALVKQYKSLPFLLSGFVFFGVIGLPQYHDFFWFFTKMPYSINSSSLYGSGSFWVYFRKMDFILNYPLIIMAVTGLIYSFLKLKVNYKNFHDIKTVTIYILVIPSIFGFIFAQSFLWWQGLGVLASNRFIACILPLVAILSVTGFEWIMDKVSFNKAAYWGIGLIIIALVIYKPFTYNRVPMKIGLNFAVMEQLTNWLKNSKYSERRAFYTDPMFPFYMDKDPFDPNECFKMYSYENVNPANLMKSGELLIWDAQFAGYEGKLPFNSLMKNDNLRLLTVFTPFENFTIIGGENYKLAVFMKAPRDTTQVVSKQFFYNDFENVLNEEYQKHVSTLKSSSGKQSIELTPDFMYSPAADGKLESLPGTSTISLKASARIFNPSTDEKGKILLVLSIDNAEHKVYKYIAAKDSDLKSNAGEWFELSLTDVIDRNTPPDGNYRVYVWYTGKKNIFVDDLKLEWTPLGSE